MSADVHAAHWAVLAESLASVSSRAAARLEAEFGAGEMFRRCFANAWTTTLRGDPAEPFVITGDIEAMWHRDTVGQLRPYLTGLPDPAVLRVLTGVVRRMARAVLADPYANAVNDGPTGGHADEHDRPAPSPDVWERKYEVDSLCSLLSFGYELWAASGSAAHLDGHFAAAADLVMRVWRVEQDHERASPYRFERVAGPFRGDTLDRGGLGSPVARTGMTWSGFRPSDDRCQYGYLIPANAAAVVALNGVVRLCDEGLLEPALRARALELAVELADGIARHGVAQSDSGPVYAYEVDGLGNVNLMDDANVPSLLSLPYLGWCDRDDPLYRRTREFVLSGRNPYYYRGRAAEGVGSPHTPARHVWPMALCVQALTAGSRQESADVYRVLLATDAGTGLMHESFHADDPSAFTRPWFAWANSLFAEVSLSLAGLPVPRPIPPVPAEVADAVRTADSPVTLRRQQFGHRR
ncbi:glycoside hydrolase family 125 protein [Nonomuraea sp. SYSU D8015]|uniref:glycoside hydrolase family 125 protein n=1 Tax=Nonomuraea sp. SYSU D8015 TaxID=2593644 RepID=UPI001CB6D3C1|nr:glycoside hydrolase family 125 protein [Nonomuraea sp. SYSU D8015]